MRDRGERIVVGVVHELGRSEIRHDGLLLHDERLPEATTDAQQPEAFARRLGQRR